MKTKWCDMADFQAQVRGSGGLSGSDACCACGIVFLLYVRVSWQDHNMAAFNAGKMHVVMFVSRMVVMGFTRATCSRSGSRLIGR